MVHLPCLYLSPPPSLMIIARRDHHRETKELGRRAQRKIFETFDSS
jgi:hypothetical protein